jgi:hypothetical protein
MFISLRMGMLTCLLFLHAPLCAAEPVAETPPTPEEIQAALDKVSKWFNWGPSRPPAAPVKQPEWYPLEAEDAKRVEEVLAAWTASRAKGGRLRCQFRKWEFDPAFGPKDRKTPYVYSEGEFRWDAPDVWMWRGTSARKAVVRGDKIEWVNEHPFNWARNKDTFYELDYGRKTRTEHRCPADLDGNLQIRFLGFFVATLPLTDLFRLDPAGLQDRFWIRPVTPKEGRSERWLELVPKKDADAKQFSSVVLAISESDWDICAMDIRAPNYSAETYPVHTSIEFMNRTTPFVATGLLKVLVRTDTCIPPVPAGWKKVVADYRANPSKK